jgi:hypothetical protein
MHLKAVRDIGGMSIPYRTTTALPEAQWQNPMPQQHWIFRCDNSSNGLQGFFRTKKWQDSPS